MGQEVHRQGLILSTDVHGTDVIVELYKNDNLSMSMLEKHLQINYPTAHIDETAHQISWTTNDAKIKIRFETQEDALHFHLSH